MKKITFLLTFALAFLVIVASAQTRNESTPRKAGFNPQNYYSITHNKTHKQNSAKTATIIFSEDFEGGVIPTGWTTTNTLPDPDCNWHIEDYSTSGASYVAETWGYDYNNGDMLDEWLITPSINLSTYTTASLCFDFFTSYYYMVTYAGADLMVKYSINGGSWTQIWREEDFGPFNDNQFYSVGIPLPPAVIGQSDVRLAFHFYGDEGDWTLIDNVFVTDAVCGANIIGTASLVSNDIVINWTIDNTPDSYNVYLNYNNVAIASSLPGSSTTYTINSSNMPTDGIYIVEIEAVYADCPSVNYEFNDVTIGTPCIWTAKLYDDGGYGWDGAYLIVVQNGVLVDYKTLPSTANPSSATVNFNVYNTTAEFKYYQGEYDEENTFEIFDASGAKVFTSQTCDNYSDYETVYTTSATPCSSTPCDLTGVTIAETSAGSHVIKATIAGTAQGTLTYSWTRNGAAFTGPGSTTDEITVTENGTYKVVVTDPGATNCTETSNEVTISDFVGLNINEISKFTVYPNPNNGQFSIDFGNITNATRYEIIDAKGAVVTESLIENGNTTIVNINVMSGNYFVKVYTTDKIYVEPVVIR